MVSLVYQLTKNLSLGVAVGGAVAISSAFVIGIHVFGKKGLSRDDPIVVKTRLAGALVGTAGGVCLFKKLINYKSIDSDFLKILGFRQPGIFPAMLASIGLTGTLFLGPLIQKLLQNDQQEPPDPDFLLLQFRTLIAAPITEELVYRGLLLPLIHPFCKSETQLIFTVPLFFGIAHIHHVFERVFIQKQNVRLSLIQTIVQLTYTTIFGAMSTFFYLKTAHLPAVIVMHGMCNYFGLPNFGKVLLEENQLKKYGLLGLYGIGFVGFCMGCGLIKPEDFSNDVFY